MADEINVIVQRNGRTIRKVETVASAESRRSFDRLNVHRTRGKVVIPASLKTATIAEGGADSDIVNTKLTGPTDKTISDGGGRRMTGAQVHVVFWGTSWIDDPAPNPSLWDVMADIERIIGGPYLDAAWQYGIGSCSLANDVWVEHRSPPPYEFTMVDVNYEAWLMMTGGYIGDGSSTIVCVVMPTGATPLKALAGEHDRSLQPNLNWIPTMWVKFDSRPNMSSTFSHELVETMTDPDGDGIQVNPTGVSDWNEVGDVCEGITGVLNGVTVQSYWSAEDNSCVIPRLEEVQAWEVLCIHKRGARDNPNENIDTVGGIHQPSGARFWMRQTEAIEKIENGAFFFTAGPGGSAKIIVRTHFPAWAPAGVKFITTVPDSSTQDNLLSLPDCGPLQNWNS